jgi:hypothetical protein
MISDFVNWCASNKLPLPATTSENTKRAGLSQEYPPGYVQSQYPDAYFAPIVATAYLDLKNQKGNNRKKPADSAW